jgi:LysR family transcriptional regulator, flagellar master operon regulator
MDTELARTFLVVIASGSFVEAAQRLHVTQSTVSTRIQRLEETLGAELFVRNKSGTTLTPAGQQFQRHAALLTRTVEQARQEIGVISGFRATLTIGGRIGLWEDLLLRWLPVFAALAPDVAVRALVAFEEQLMEALIDGRANIGVMYTPHSRPGLTVEPLLEEQLVMVSSRADPPREPASDYIYVDWGAEFFAQHSLAFPNFLGAALTVNIDRLARIAAASRAWRNRLFSDAHVSRARTEWASASCPGRTGISAACLPVLSRQSGFRTARACAGNHPSHRGGGGVTA